MKSYHSPAELPWSFVPGLGIAIFTHTYVVHQSIAVNKTFS